MKVGVQHAAGDPAWVPAILSPDAVRRFARSAEASGFGAIGFTDHPAPSARWVESGGEGVADPWSSLGFCAAVTESIRLLTFLLIPPYHNPFVMAHQVATLDALSGGRLTVGLGTGYLKSEFHALGAGPGPERLASFDERVALMREAWLGGDITSDGGADGGTWSARGVRIQPIPVQQPHPPLWLHGNSPFGVRRAAQWGQGWIGMVTGHDETIVRTTRTTPIPDLDVLARRIEELRAATEKAGRRVDEVEVVVSGVWSMIDARRGWDVDAYLSLAEKVSALGASWIMVTCCGDDPGAAVEAVERFGQEVVSPAASI